MADGIAAGAALQVLPAPVCAVVPILRRLALPGLLSQSDSTLEGKGSINATPEAGLTSRRPCGLFASAALQEQTPWRCRLSYPLQRPPLPLLL
jgi:hypothetical protein